MNVGRGAFRLWVVFSVLWVGLYSYLGLYAAQIDVECVIGVEMSNCYPHPIEHLVGIIELVAGPPIAARLFGLALRWALLGFRAKPADELADRSRVRTASELRTPEPHGAKLSAATRRMTSL